MTKITRDGNPIKFTKDDLDGNYLIMFDDMGNQYLSGYIIEDKMFTYLTVSCDYTFTVPLVDMHISVDINGNNNELHLKTANKLLEDFLKDPQKYMEEALEIMQNTIDEQQSYHDQLQSLKPSN